MKYMGLNEIRKAFLDFYAERGHYVTSSYSLIPSDDKSLLLVNAGMQPLKKYFTGAEVPPQSTMATCQKCIRTGDIENVGITARHCTFFEMLGNFSFGDYFKERSIQLGWTFITEVLELPADRLWPSVYEEDEEAFAIWRDVIGIPEARITRLGKADNFWEIGTGPCGPCSEIYFDRGEAYGCGDPDCRPGCECERFLEFWNHVFTQYDRDEQGHYHELEKKNIDTGMGLERIACILQDVDTIFEVDTIRAIRDAVIEAANVAYGEASQKDISIRIVTDHIKAVTFMVGDGIMPNNEGRGYVLRRLLRRAARHARTLGIPGARLIDFVDVVIDMYGDNYGNLRERSTYIKRVLEVEIQRFEDTIDQGLSILDAYIEALEADSLSCLSGEHAFKLYDTYGFPLELTEEILSERGMTVNVDDFNAHMEAQRERARTARGDGDALGWAEDGLAALPKSIVSVFDGYTDTKRRAKVVGIVGEAPMETAFEGMDVTVILDETPFYPEGGGQCGDRGRLYGAQFSAHVHNTQKGVNQLIAHSVHIDEGTLSVGDAITAQVDEKRRLATARNHTATHLLHKALREVLGDHVQQAGSLVTPEKLRFDFSHFEPISEVDLNDVERRVNARVLQALPVSTECMDIASAKQMGAMALFGEKYGDTVRVVKVGDYSTELCGGTHVSSASEIGLFKITSESGIAAGVRRIEAITGEAVYAHICDIEHRQRQLAALLKTTEGELEQRVHQLVADHKAANKENEQLKARIANASYETLLENMRQIGDFSVMTGAFTGVDMSVLRTLGDRLKDAHENSVVVLATSGADKVSFLAMASASAVALGAHAGNIIREVAKIAGGGGGGKPEMAQAGGKDPKKVSEALEKVYILLG